MPAFAITFAAGCARQRIGIRTLEAPATTKVAVATTHLQPELAAAELASPPDPAIPRAAPPPAIPPPPKLDRRLLPLLSRSRARAATDLTCRLGTG